MLTIVLALHSWLRWLVVASGIAATVTALMAPGDRSEAAAADRWSAIFTGLLDLQMLIGLVLYLFLSPTTTAIFGDFGGAMGDPVARFWAVEHTAMMVLSIVFAHMGRVLVRKAPTPAKKRTRRIVFMVLATVVMLAAIPWPGMRAGRPLVRGL
jgi:hypothetical protein